MKHIRVLSLLLVMLILASCTAESISGGNVTAIGTGTEQTTKSDVQENGADFTKETEEKQEMTEKTTPEKEGLSSEGIAAMMDGLKKAQLAMHSVLIMRHGEIVAEGYAEPFDKDSLHRMYSVSKSFVGIAIGVLESEGKISINDTIDKARSRIGQGRNAGNDKKGHPQQRTHGQQNFSGVLGYFISHGSRSHECFQQNLNRNAGKAVLKLFLIFRHRLAFCRRRRIRK